MNAARQVRKVLILSADIGGGHDAMAKALARDIGKVSPTTEVEIANGLRIGNPSFYRLVRDSYFDHLEKGAPLTYDLFYRALGFGPVTGAMRGVSELALTRRLGQYIDEHSPDLVVSTYPVVTAALGSMRTSGRLKQPVAAALIDSNPHPTWFKRGVDRHITMTPKDYDRLVAERPLGIMARSHLNLVQARPPIDPATFDRTRRAATRADFDLPTDQSVVLVSGGALGVGIGVDDVRRMVASSSHVFAVLTGRNERLAAQIAAELPADRVKAIGFTDRMPDLLASADAIVTNAGGMTTFESFAARLPVIMFKPLAGHGTDGAAALHADGYALYARSQNELDAALAAVGTASGEPARRAQEAATIFDRSTPGLAETVLALA